MPPSPSQRYAGGEVAGAAYVFQEPPPGPPEDCVGGIAELPDVAGTPLEAEAGGPWGPSASVVAGVVAAIAAGALALGGAAWYARRRRG